MLPPLTIQNDRHFDDSIPVVICFIEILIESACIAHVGLDTIPNPVVIEFDVEASKTVSETFARYRIAAHVTSYDSEKNIIEVMHDGYLKQL
jgi:hypothetical protein